MEVAQYEFKKAIAEDYGIELRLKNVKKLSDFPIKNGKRKINSHRESVIVDSEGNEHPYFLDYSRNEEKLIDFDHIYFYTIKSLNQIIDESGIILKTQPCKICEGGGWYSNGTKYFYKDISCEV